MGKIYPDKRYPGGWDSLSRPGWRTWATVPATLIIHAVTCGVGYSAGVYYFRIRQQFGENNFLTSCVGSLLLAMMAVAGLFLVDPNWCHFRGLHELNLRKLKILCLNN